MQGFFGFIGKAKTALRLPAREKVWFCLAYPLSGFVRLAILILPFRAIASVLGRPTDTDSSSIVPISETSQDLARRLGRICSLVARYTPWESKCLVQAVAVAVGLRFYGIPGIVYLGVVNSDGPLKAHAWVKVGDLVVSGREGHRAFTVIAAYGVALNRSRNTNVLPTQNI
ncbi:lasso peptide biosynthesis B2 protein [Puniceicoccaceae bacterium K14]|nr:lasso peptide biosynthesis B2 protein [Puniceicoccaceae bacterium K14]